jgi:hypothetical protein
LRRDVVEQYVDMIDAVVGSGARGPGARQAALDADRFVAEQKMTSEERAAAEYNFMRRTYMKPRGSWPKWAAFCGLDDAYRRPARTKGRVATELRRMGLQLTKTRDPRKRARLKKEIHELRTATFGGAAQKLGVIASDKGWTVEERQYPGYAKDYCVVDPEGVKEQCYSSDEIGAKELAIDVMHDRARRALAALGIITREGGEFCVRSETNPTWSGGCYPTRGQAARRLEQVEHFKKAKGA